MVGLRGLLRDLAEPPDFDAGPSFRYLDFFPGLSFWHRPFPEEGHLFIAVSAIIAVLALGTWWFYFSEAAVTRKRDEKQRELERPDYDHERARQTAEIQSELSRIKGWTSAGS